MHHNHSTRCAALVLVIFCYASPAQTLTTDTTWTAHSSIGLTEDVIVSEGVTLTIEEGVDVWVDLLNGANASITVYGNLVVNGTEAAPVLLGSEPNPNAYFDGVLFDGLSSGSISHAEMRIVRASPIGVLQDFFNTDPTPRVFAFEHVTITENADFGFRAVNPAVLIVANPVGPQSVSISGCNINGIIPDSATTFPDGDDDPFPGDPGNDGTLLNRDGGRGGDGFPGGNGDIGESGADTIGIMVFGSSLGNPDDLVTIHNTRIHTLKGQNAGHGSNGGTGSRGGRGGKGKNVTAGKGGKGGRGGNGGKGGDGGRGGNGGNVTAISLISPPDCVITQCLIYDLYEGSAGRGGNGNIGGNAGDGGNGGNSNTIAGDGGNGGNGGNTGNGGAGGNGGIEGSARAIEIIDAARDVSMVNNTVTHTTVLSSGGRAGQSGDRGILPGLGGARGIALGAGSNGRKGSDGNFGFAGPTGSVGSGGMIFGVQVSNNVTSPPQTLIANNIFSNRSVFSPASGVESNGTSNVLFQFNSVYGFASTTSGTGTLFPTLTIVSDPLLVNYRPSAGSQAIDSGNNTFAINAGLRVDLAGNPRFQDDLASPDIGTGNISIVDRGAFEFAGLFCQADVNSDGLIDNGDISAFVTLFLAGDLASDMNGDGFLDGGDINTFITLFLAGC